MKKFIMIGVGMLAILITVAATQITIFVIPPIGAIPDGRTIIIARLNKTNFIDSPDAMCERIQGGVSLLCRGMILSAVADKTTIYARLPYSDFLYQISTNGKTYTR